jgi:hypothetical protein
MNAFSLCWRLRASRSIQDFDRTGTFWFRHSNRSHATISRTFSNIPRVITKVNCRHRPLVAKRAPYGPKITPASPFSRTNPPMEKTVNAMRSI